MHTTHTWAKTHFLIDLINGILKNTLPPCSFLKLSYFFMDMEMIVPWIIKIGIFYKRVPLEVTSRGASDTSTFFINSKRETQQCMTCIDGDTIRSRALSPERSSDESTIHIDKPGSKPILIKSKNISTRDELEKTIEKGIRIGTRKCSPLEKNKVLLFGCFNPKTKPIVEIFFCPFVLVKEAFFENGPVLFIQRHFNIIKKRGVQHLTVLTYIAIKQAFTRSQDSKVAMHITFVPFVQKHPLLGITMWFYQQMFISFLDGFPDHVPILGDVVLG